MQSAKKLKFLLNGVGESHVVLNVLYKQIYRQSAAYGQFGCDDIQLPWERTDKAEALKSAAGL